MELEMGVRPLQTPLCTRGLPPGTASTLVLSLCALLTFFVHGRFACMYV